MSKKTKKKTSNKGKNSGLKAGLAVGIPGALIIGILLGLLWPGGAMNRGCTGTSINLIIADDFGVNGNETWNCSGIIIYAMLLDSQTVDALDAFFAQNRSSTIGYSNFTSETGVEYAAGGYTWMYWGDYFSNPTNTSKMDGRSYDFTFGNWYVMPSIEIETFNGSTHVYEEYMPLDNLIFAWMFVIGGLNRTTWENVTLFHCANTLEITGWTYDSAAVLNSTLQVDVNGDAQDWVWYPSP